MDDYGCDEQPSWAGTLYSVAAMSFIAACVFSGPLSLGLFAGAALAAALGSNAAALDRHEGDAEITPDEPWCAESALQAETPVLLDAIPEQHIETKRWAEALQAPKCGRTPRGR